MQNRKKADNASLLSVNAMTANLFFQGLQSFSFLFIPDSFYICIHQMAAEISINEGFQP